MQDAGSGATAVINHRVRVSQHEQYERWLEKIVPLARASPGFLDVQVIRPVPGLTDNFTVLLRFDCEASLRRWLESPARSELIETAMPILVQGDSYTIHSGLDFLFTPHDRSQRVPVRWKQFLVTWSAIFPLTLVLPLLLRPVFDALGLGSHHLVVSLLASGVAVLLMVYLIMPRYTKLVRRWLYR